MKSDSSDEPDDADKGSTDRQFRGPIGPDERSKIFENLLVLVRFGPRLSGYLKNASVLDPKLRLFRKPHSMQMRNWTKLQLFTETASVPNADLGHNSDIY